MASPWPARQEMVLRPCATSGGICGHETHTCALGVGVRRILGTFGGEIGRRPCGQNLWNLRHYGATTFAASHFNVRLKPPNNIKQPDINGGSPVPNHLLCSDSEPYLIWGFLKWIPKSPWVSIQSHGNL